MKKSFIAALVLGLVFQLTVPACAYGEEAAGTLQAVELEGASLQDGGLQVGDYFESVVRPDGELVSLSADLTVVQELERRLCAAWENREGRIDIEDLKINKDEVGNLYFAVRNRHPEYFFVSNEISIWGYEGDPIVTEIECKYGNYSENDVVLFEAKRDYVLSQIIRPGMSDLEKVLAIHDYLVLNAEYDAGTYESTEDMPADDFNAYGILVKGVGVCQGYAMAAGLLMDQVGIENFFAASDEMNHAWNLVRLGDQWYHMDITWDDPVPDVAGRLYHSFFLLSDTTISTVTDVRQEPHTGWESGGIVCNDADYESGYLFSGTKKAYYAAKDSGYWNLEVSDSGGYRIARYNSDLKTADTLADGLSRQDVCSDGRNYYYFSGDSIFRVDTTAVTKTVLYQSEGPVISGISLNVETATLAFGLAGDSTPLGRSVSIAKYMNDFAYEIGEVVADGSGARIGVRKVGGAEPPLYIAAYGESGRLVSLTEWDPIWEQAWGEAEWQLLMLDEHLAGSAVRVKVISVDEAGKPMAESRSAAL